MAVASSIQALQQIVSGMNTRLFETNAALERRVETLEDRVREQARTIERLNTKMTKMELNALTGGQGVLEGDEHQLLPPSFPPAKRPRGDHNLLQHMQQIDTFSSSNNKHQRKNSNKQHPSNPFEATPVNFPADTSLIDAAGHGPPPGGHNSTIGGTNYTVPNPRAGHTNVGNSELILQEPIGGEQAAAARNEHLRDRVMHILMTERQVDQGCLSFFQKEQWCWDYFLPMLEDRSMPKKTDSNESAFWTHMLKQHVAGSKSRVNNPQLEARILNALKVRDIDQECYQFLLLYPNAWDAIVTDLEDFSQPPHEKDQSRFWTAKWRNVLQAKGLLGPRGGHR
ncbi:unnamed protein product [Amoebophrya sp. A120]|nr:unnamed protein product [Amoebophrya sp. A120]|eukprot:GSA120T00005673001.1